MKFYFIWKKGGFPDLQPLKSRTGMSDYCEARISHEILAGFWKIGGFPKP